MNIEKEVEKIVAQFGNFMDGYRVIMLTHRSKEGGHNRDRKQVKRISANREEFEAILHELLDIKEKSGGIPYRIYANVNARDINKAIRIFRQNQLDAEYYDEESRLGFYLDIKNRWISALMRPQAKAEALFMFDLDGEYDLDEIRGAICKVTRNMIVYKTKNGHHIITEPFNPMMLPTWVLQKHEIKKDSMLLLHY